ncbi:MAG: carbohydrate ABC transporter permease [Caldilineaceae bacterium]|nr:carbohydrate ABC transporter permease [Caldilineaceae bacterium]
MDTLRPRQVVSYSSQSGGSTEEHKTKPALVTVAVFTVLNTWNDFLAPLLYLRSDDNFTVALGLATFRSVMNTRWDLFMAASTAMIVPVILLFFFFAQRHFVEGIVLSGLKG